MGPPCGSPLSEGARGPGSRSHRRVPTAGRAPALLQGRAVSGGRLSPARGRRFLSVPRVCSLPLLHSGHLFASSPSRAFVRGSLVAVALLLVPPPPGGSGGSCGGGGPRPRVGMGFSRSGRSARRGLGQALTPLGLLASETWSQPSFPHLWAVRLSTLSGTAGI